MDAEAVVAEFWTGVQICPAVGLETLAATTEPRLRRPGQLHCKRVKDVPAGVDWNPELLAAEVQEEEYEKYE